MVEGLQQTLQAFVSADADQGNQSLGARPPPASFHEPHRFKIFRNNAGAQKGAAPVPRLHCPSQALPFAPPPPAAAAQPGRSHEQQRQMVREGRVPTGGPLTSVAATAAPRLPGVAAGGVSQEYRALLIMDSHNTRVHPECVAEAQRLGFDILLFPGAHK
jgi:hypothetical protein